MLIHTQIGGKYHKDDNSLFHLKKILQSVGVKVSHPIADQIVYSHDGQGFAFDPTKISFPEVEADYYNSIATSSFHTVNNIFLSDKGYIGESAALEMAYAMLQGKPILLMHPMHLKDSLALPLKELLLDRVNEVEVHDIHELERETVNEICLTLPNRLPQYEIAPDEEKFILGEVQKLFSKLKAEPVDNWGLS